MSFPRYPAYKPSGVEWLGEVPEHWEVKPVFAVARERNEDNKGMKEDNLLSLSYGSIVNKDINTSDGLLPESFETYQIVSPGDIVLRLTDLQNDKRSLRSALATQRGIITSAYLALQPKDIESRYLSYLLRAYDASKVFYSMGGGLRQSMKFADVKRMPLVLPGKIEQTGISAFLDRETAKVDALIAEQQRLIELLQEKRQAVISHAVTKGLNPDAPMKDSGVEWLGEVQEHWEVQRVKHLCRHIEQGWSPQCENDASEGDSPGVLKVGCVNGGIFRPGENKRLPPDLSPIPEYSLRKGDLLISRANTKELVGSAAVVSEDYPWLFICDKLYRITVDLSLASAAFLALYLGSSEVRGQIELGASGASQSMQNISQSVLMELPIALPDLDEQEAIQNAIANECCSIDELVAEGSRAIALFQERRSALISAAVTGQIDVRGLVPEAEAV